jgi:hypothetical protein
MPSSFPPSAESPQSCMDTGIAGYRIHSDGFLEA